ncbi:MAG: hypothetical protein H6594_00110 [Flavobacteriales bacterium]|nr:hypothetical protein [Flavobacteriales bacterium]
MTRSPFRASAVMVALLSGWILLPSCNKEKPTKAIITIVDEDGAIVPEAYVKLYANPTYPLGDPSRLTQEMMTGSDGTAEFDYTSFYEQGQAGFAVLDIVSFKDSAVGEGIIKIVEEETNEETVTLVPVTP